jgi:hypothetical protein
VQREDEGEERGHAERDQRPDEEEATAGTGDATRDADTLPFHMDDGDAEPKERTEKHDYVSRSSFGKHKRSVQPNDKYGYTSER